jgi:DNA-binding HxlR family transcriptional regulator
MSASSVPRKPPLRLRRRERPTAAVSLRRAKRPRIALVSDEGSKIRSSVITRAIRVLGDRWSILIIRDAFQGVRRFQGFLDRTGTSRATLTNRLRSLVKTGIFRRVRYSDAPLRYEYRLTDKGRDLYPLSLVAWSWERRWAPQGAGIPAALIHRACQHETRPVVTCAHCRAPLTVRNTLYQPGPGQSARGPAGARYRRLSALTARTHRGSHAGLVHIADIVGDPWTPLVIAAAFFRLRRFDDIQRALRIATNILSSRLDLLVRQRILERRLYTAQPKRYEYRLTDKGRDLFGYALLLNAWGDRWLASAAGPPFLIVHEPCGRTIAPVVRCEHCGGTLVPGSTA